MWGFVANTIAFAGALTVALTIVFFSTAVAVAFADEIVDVDVQCRVGDAVEWR